jgi:hypothetical protein
MLFFTHKQFLYFIDQKLKSRVPGISWIFLYLFGCGFGVIFGSIFVFSVFYHNPQCAFRCYYTI